MKINSFFLFLRCEGLISSPLCFTSGIREHLCCCWKYVGLNFLSVLGLIREIYVFCSFLRVMCCSKWHAWVCWLMMFVLHVQMEEIGTSILVKGNVIRLLQSKGQITKLKKVSGSEWVFLFGIYKLSSHCCCGRQLIACGIMLQNKLVVYPHGLEILGTQRWLQ